MLDPLDTLPPWSGQYRTLGWQIAEWSVGRFIVPDGTAAGSWLELSDRQLCFLLHWYAIGDRGEFVYSGAAMRHARGTGKSPLMAFLACCELLGPVRFAGWDVEGEPVGTRAPMPLVTIAAVSEHQTENVMNYVREWLGNGSPLHDEYGLDSGKRIVYVPRFGDYAGGSLRIITSSAATARGARPTAVFADETSEWTQTNGGTAFRARLGENAAKVPGSRVVEGANAWTPGTGSVAEERWDAFQAEYEQTGGSSFLMDAREAPADTDWSDADSVREALGVVYGPSPWVDPDQFMPTILDRFKPVNESMREFGNLRVSELTSWVSAQDWDACADVTASLADGDEVVLFCDPSDSDDATALVACRVDDGLVVPLWIHEPNAIGPNGQRYGPVSPAELDHQVTVAFDRFAVCGFFSDVHPMEQLVKDTWKHRYGDALVLWASRTEPVAFEMRDRNRKAFAQAAELTAAQIVQGELVHNGDGVLSRHVHNAERKPEGQFVSVRKPEQSRKIDAAVSMIGARMARAQLLDSAAWSKYAKRRNRKVLVWR